MISKMQDSIPLFDYLVNQRSFDPAKIPLFVIYKIENNGENNSSLLLQYKVSLP